MRQQDLRQKNAHTDTQTGEYDLIATELVRRLIKIYGHFR